MLLFKGGTLKVGQLIKLQDYISRYEQNIFSYPSRFVRLKLQQWERTKENWETEGMDASNLSFQSAPPEWMDEKEKQPFFKKIRGMLRLNGNYEEADIRSGNEQEEVADNQDQESSSLHFTAAFSQRPGTEDQLKQQFLDQLLKFQLKWASSTLSEKSFLDHSYNRDQNLRFFLQRFPDTFLILYNPVFLLKKAPVEAEIILITPADIWCISFLEEEDLSVFSGSSERFWVKRNNREEKKILNPLLALNRTEKIVRKIFQIHEMDLPIHKMILSRNGYIDYPSPPIDVQFVEKRNFNQWFQSMRSFKAPLKHAQLKCAQALLQYCQTTSVRRLEWETADEN
jgi:hypothetical protein